MTWVYEGLDRITQISENGNDTTYRYDLNGKSVYRQYPLAALGKKGALEGYQWSSYPFYVGKSRKVPEWLRRTRLFEACELEEGRRGCMSRYRLLTESRMLGESDDLPCAYREQVERQLRRGWYIRSDSFGEELVGRIAESSDNLRGEQRRTHGELEA